MVRRRNRRRNRRRFVRRGRGLRRAFNGGLIRGRMHPPTNSASPWNNYVLTFLWTPTAPDFKGGIVCISATEIRKLLKKELGIPDADKVDVRLFRVDIWTQPQEADTDRNCVVFSPSDWSNYAACTSWAQINWYESWGTAVQPAHCHYIWPKSISNVVLPFEQECVLCRLDCKDSKVKLICKFHLTWRPSNPDPYPTVSGMLTSLRTHLRFKPPVDEDDDDFCPVGIGDMAISPIAVGCNSVNPPL